MKTFKALLTFSAAIFLVINVNARSSDKANIAKCLKLIKAECGSKDYKACMSAPTKKSSQVSECLSFLATQNTNKKVDTSGLGASVKKLITSSEMSEDQRKCFELSKVVCKEGEDLDSCMKKRAGKFPSFCREAAIQGIDKLKDIYRDDRKAAMCADLLVAKCDFTLPEAKEKPDPKEYQAALGKYQACLKSQIIKEKECNDVVDPKKNDGATQLIR